MTDLPIDREVEGLRALLREAQHEPNTSNTEIRARVNEEVARLVDAYGDEVVAFGLGRAVQRDAREQARLERAKARIVAQYDDAISSLNPARSLFELVIGDLALRHRERTKRATMEIPGVGVWRTRLAAVDADGNPDFVAKVTDPEVVVEALRGTDEFERLIEVTKVEKPKTNDVKAWAIERMRATGEMTPGVEVARAEVTVSPPKNLGEGEVE